MFTFDKSQIEELLFQIHPSLKIGDQASEFLLLVLNRFNNRLNVNTLCELEEKILQISEELGRHALNLVTKRQLLSLEDVRATILEYFCVDILEAVGTRIKFKNRVEICIQDLYDAIVNDEEMFKALRYDLEPRVETL